jgi:predicted phosphate transport protein (TIGR00153 family)
MFDCFVNDDLKTAQELYDKIRQMEEAVDAERRRVTKELSDIGLILSSREDFLRFVNQAGDIVDFSKGIGFRLIAVMERGWKGSSAVKNGLLNLSERMFDTVIKLRETIIALNYSSIRAIEKAREVEVAERVVDDLYRKIEIDLLNSDLDVPDLLLLRDITQLMEDISDKAEDASDAARVLAFAI